MCTMLKRVRGRQVTRWSSLFILLLGTAAGTVHAQQIYWAATENGAGKIYTANLDGTGERELFDPALTSSPINALAVSTGKVYWSAMTAIGAVSIYVANLDGSGEQVLFDPLLTGNEVDSLAIAGGKIYWSAVDSPLLHNLYVANLDGSGERVLFDPVLTSSPISGLARSGGRIYWSATDSLLRNRLYVAELNGTSEQVLFDPALTSAPIESLSINGGNVFWSSRSRSSEPKVYAADLRGNGEQVLFDPALTSTAVKGLEVACGQAGSFTIYGQGCAGTTGIPGLVPSGNPVLCQPLTITVDNSRGASTLGLLFLGVGRASIPALGCEILVAVPWTLRRLWIPTGGLSLSATLCDPSLCGTTVNLQVLEVDPGAALGISFTPGLELVFGGF